MAVDMNETHSARPSLKVSRYFRFKGIVSRLAGACLLLPGAALMLPLIVLVRCSSKGPAIYRQLRVGRGGRTFMMYKLRTMRHDAEAHSGPVWCGVDDPRITRLGRVLRKLHLDELPQLINVVRGEMDLFGPRPERPEFVAILERRIPGYGDRHLVAPGVTGLAQINLPPDTDFDSVRRKIVLDRYYIENANLLLDLRMFSCTILRVFGLQGELVMKLMGLNYRHLVDRTELTRNGLRGRLAKTMVPAEAIQVAPRNANGFAVNGNSPGPVCDSMPNLATLMGTHSN
jgi:lipopolysaccharide/colanic/teichoic acid biosynthesis glycosyltransferase